MIIKNDVARVARKKPRRKVSITPFKCKECGFTGRLVTGFPRNCIENKNFKCPVCYTIIYRY
jgi:predicted RNA-binding Zn-ribbon protein involved in translation (DUF1610 family)